LREDDCINIQGRPGNYSGRAFVSSWSKYSDGFLESHRVYSTS
jgi:hypothetical protein